MNKSTCMYILSMAVFGSLGPFVWNIAVSSGELALYRAMMGAALIGGYLLVKKQNPFSAGMRREVFLLLLSGAAAREMKAFQPELHREKRRKPVNFL